MSCYSRPISGGDWSRLHGESSRTRSPPPFSTRHSIFRWIEGGLVTTGSSNLATRYRLHRRAALNRNRLATEPGHLQSTRTAGNRTEPSGRAVDPLHLVSLVRVLHRCARNHGVRYGFTRTPTTCSPAWTARTGRFPHFRLGHGSGRRSVVDGFTGDDPARAARAKDRTRYRRLVQGLIRMVGTHGAAHRKGSPVFLAKRHAAELAGVRSASRRAIRRVQASR